MGSEQRKEQNHEHDGGAARRLSSIDGTGPLAPPPGSSSNCLLSLQSLHVQLHYYFIAFMTIPCISFLFARFMRCARHAPLCCASDLPPTRRSVIKILYLSSALSLSVISLRTLSWILLISSSVSERSIDL